MYRKLFNRAVLGEVGSLTLTNYGLHFAIGIVLFLQLFLAVEARLGVELTATYAVQVTVAYSLAFAVGAKLLRVLYNLGQLRRNPRELLRRSGNSFYGGVAGFAAASYLMARISGVSFWTQLDVSFLCLPAFQVFIRLGCASYGCCFGHPNNGPTAITYFDIHAPAFLRHGSTPLHPSQFYSILKNLGIFTISFALFSKTLIKGMPVALWLMLYPTLRFFVDFTRDPAKKPYYGGLRSSQWISIGLFATGVAILLGLPLERYPTAMSTWSALWGSLRYFPIILLGFAVNLLAFGVSFVISDRKHAGIEFPAGPKIVPASARASE
jgi:phosphatidylglycerol---prolipoprotein diacylglyceryl transferase